jgi:hypothetical protein
MKLLLVTMIVAAVFTITSRSSAQDHAVALPGTTADRASVNANNQSAATANATPRSGDSGTNDDSLYRGKTNETGNPMLRDEGALHFKPRAKEKVQEVDDLKDLRTSGSDSTFQGSLLHNGLTSINDVGAKSIQSAKVPDSRAPGQKRHQVFQVPDEPVKTEAAKSDSSPSQSPSLTASPTPGH